jgi:flagellar basal-body rod protein FlgB
LVELRNAEKGPHVLPVSDTTMAAAEYALRGLALRADVHAHNVANVNTPGFRAQRVDFESALHHALASKDPQMAGDPEVLPEEGLANGQDNTVTLETEVVGMMKTSLLRDAMVNAYNFKVGVLRAAIGGR